MQISLPEPFERTLSPARATLHLAIGLYTANEATLGQAAEAAGVNQTEFLHELGRRRISLHYGREDFAADLITLQELSSR